MHKTRTKFREYILQDFKYKKSEISLIGQIKIATKPNLNRSQEVLITNNTNESDGKGLPEKVEKKNVEKVNVEKIIKKENIEK